MKEMKKKTGGVTYRLLTFEYCLLQGLYWTASAAEMDFAAVPLLRERGFSSISIGVISAAKFLSLMFFQYLIGGFADRHRDRFPIKRIVNFLTIIAIAAALSMWLLPSGFILSLIVFIIFGGSVNCILPLIEALSIDYMSGGMKLNYTLSRATGSLTYCIAAYLLGMLTDRNGLDFSLVFLALTLAVFLFINLIMPQAPECGIKRASTVHSASFLLRNCKRYRWFLAECFFVFLGYDMNIAFLYDRVKDIGATNSEYGLIYSMIALFEIPVALGFSKLLDIKGMSIERLMASFGIFCTARAFFTTISTNMTAMLLSQSFELFGMGVFYAGSVFFVMKTVPAEDSAKGMSLVNLIGVGASETAAYFLSGFIRGSLGLMPLMYISCAVSAVGIIAGIPVASRYDRR